MPDANQCQGEFGTSVVNGADIVTGTASYTSGFAGTFGTDANGDLNLTKTFGKSASTGIGLLVVENPYGTANGGKGSKLLLRGGTDAGEVPDVSGPIAPRPNGGYFLA
ncbi:MAG: hypothetical protein ACI9WC_000090 [Arenicella sp.]